MALRNNSPTQRPPETAEQPFFKSRNGALDIYLFKVRAGIPVHIALEHAGNFLQAAVDLGWSHPGGAKEESGSTYWSVLYLASMAKALLDASLAGIELAEDDADH